MLDLTNHDVQLRDRHDVTRGRLRISGELPLNERVVYGIAAKHARCIVTRRKYTIYHV